MIFHRTFLPLPLRMALPVVAVGALCTVLIGVVEYVQAVRSEGRAIQRFVEAAESAMASVALDAERAPQQVADRLAGLQGRDAVFAWRVLESADGGEVLRSPHAEDFDFNRVASLDHAVVWTPGPGGAQRLERAALRDNLVIRLPFASRGGAHEMLEVVIDGPARHRAALRQIAEGLAPTTAGFAVICLVVVGLVHRWISRPLACLQASVTQTQPEVFAEPGEGAWASGGLAGTLEAICRTLREEQLASREQVVAAQALADAAPQGLIGVDRAGVIRSANRGAARQLGVDKPAGLLGRVFAEFLTATDAEAFNQALASGANGPVESASLRVRLRHDPNADASTTGPTGLLIGAFDPQTQQTAVVLQSRGRGDALQERLAHQRRLLQAAIDTLPEPWLLTDPRGRVLIVNRAWIGQTRQSVDTLTQSDLTDAATWSAWEAPAAERAAAWVADMVCGVARETEASPAPLIDTPDGRRVLQAQLCCARPGIPDGYAWTLRDPQAASSFGPPSGGSAHARPPRAPAAYSDLREARATSDLMDAAVEAVRALAGTPAAGIAVRAVDSTGRRRSDQRLAIGGTSVPMRAYTALRDAAESDLMPEVMGAAGSAVAARTADPDTEWGQALLGCGLSAFAAVKLQGLGDQLGVLWIGQRTGQAVEPGGVETLTRAAELIGARLDTLRLGESFQDLGLLDATTGLPTTPALLRHLQAMPGPPEPTTPHHLFVFTLDPAVAAAGSDRLDAYAELAADCLRARCRRGVFLATTGPGRFAVVVHAMAPQHAESLGERLLASLCGLRVPGIRDDAVSIARIEIPNSQDEADARAMLDAAHAASAAAERRRAS